MEPTTDANPTTDSSPAVVPDATVVSSTTPDPGAKPEASWDEFVPEVTPTAPPAAKTEEPVVPSVTPPVKDGITPPPSAPEGKKEGDITPPDDSKLPFHQHPRWQEVIKERDNLKQATEAVKPFVEQQRNLDNFLRTNHITPERFGQVLHIAALMESDPAAARKALQPEWDRLSQFEGQVLPKDLQEKVERGTMTAEDAQAWAKDRAVQQFNQQRSQQDTLHREEEAQATALDEWVNQKRKSDADYELKREEVEDRHLKLVSMEYARQGIGQPGRPTRLPANTLVQLADQAYVDITGRWGKRTPAPKPTTTHLSPTTSPLVSKTIPVKWDDAVEDLITQYAGT